MSERRALGLVIRILAYFAALAGVASVVARWIPQWGAYFTDRAPRGAAVAMLGALALTCPVAWMYMRTKPKERYDPSLVHTLIILPVVIAGIVLIVHDSVALAFSLAGIVAAVRFRNTLRDTKDAVYIFLAIALGLAAGVQSFSAAFVMSLVYVLVVLALWRFDVGAAPAAARLTGVLVADGAPRVSADSAIAAALDRHARKWKLLREVPSDEGRATFTYRVRLRRRTTPDALLDEVRRAVGA